MRLIKIAVGSVDTTVGAVHANLEAALGQARAMAAAGVTLGVFQEQLLGGYPPEDLVQWQGFCDAQARALGKFAAATAALGTVYVVGLVITRGAHRHNVAAVVHRGVVLGLVPKEQLPTYSVFYEARTFSPGVPGRVDNLVDGTDCGDLIFQFDWGTLGVEVCEDAWSPDGPMRRRAYAGAEVIANVSASPFRVGVQATRREMLATRSADAQATLVYANAVGGQDGLIFDGGGFVFQNGRVVLEAPRFAPGWHAHVVDLDRTVRLRAENTTWRNDALRTVAQGPQPRLIVAPGKGADRTALAYPVPPGRSFFQPPDDPPAPPSPREVFCEEILDALALGLGSYVKKCGFKGVGIALSGGRDSLLCLLIAHRWAMAETGGDHAAAARLITPFYMPTRFSSEITRTAAERISADLGLSLTIQSIEEAFGRELDATRAMLGGAEPTAITVQNIQARIRAQRMWNWANTSGALFVQTGNMSEKSVGYTTIGGDLEGALSLISNLPKTVVMTLIDHLARKTGHAGIARVLEQPAGPELAANQEGEKELMPFPLLDACFALYAGEKMTPAEMRAALGSIFPEIPATTLATQVDRFVGMFTRSIYKWVQAPLGLHVGNLDLDRERALQLPVVERTEWTRED
jgi:NAD+ synthase (glutamine-hydrolysing)